MSIEAALVNKILNTPGVTALIGDRLSHFRLTQGTTVPAVTYRRLDDSSEPINVTQSSLTQSFFRFECMGLTAKMANDVADQLRTCLDAFTGTILGVRIGAITYQGRIDGYNEDAKLFVVAADFDVWFNF